jgi:molecular chaperone HscB
LSAQLAVDDFELFDIPKQFSQDRAALDARWKNLQREAHPDKFSAQGTAAQRVAMQWSVRINQAYQRLKDPIASRGVFHVNLLARLSTPRTTPPCRQNS